MKVNPDKYHLLTSANTSLIIKTKANEIFNSDKEKLLGVAIDSKLNFNIHLDQILKKTNKKVHVLAKIAPYMSISKRKLPMIFFL